MNDIVVVVMGIVASMLGFQMLDKSRQNDGKCRPTHWGKAIGAWVVAVYFLEDLTGKGNLRFLAFLSLVFLGSAPLLALFLFWRKSIGVKLIGALLGSVVAYSLLSTILTQYSLFPEDTVFLVSLVAILLLLLPFTGIAGGFRRWLNRRRFEQANKRHLQAEQRQEQQVIEAEQRERDAFLETIVDELKK